MATLAKVLESFVRPWILECLGGSLDDLQYNPHRQWSMMHAQVDMLHHWHAAADQCECARTVFVDFAKAFDEVDHTLLVTKTVAPGLPNIIMW